MCIGKRQVIWWGCLATPESPEAYLHPLTRDAGDTGRGCITPCWCSCEQADHMLGACLLVQKGDWWHTAYKPTVKLGTQKFYF